MPHRSTATTHQSIKMKHQQAIAFWCFLFGGLNDVEWYEIIGAAVPFLLYAGRIERLMTRLVSQNERYNEQHLKAEKDIKVLDQRVDDHEVRIKVMESK